MGKVTLIATAAMGIEALVAEEVRSLGYENCVVENGKVIFEADEKAICRSNLWLRTADRVKLKIGEFKATTFDELFERTKKLNWAQFIPVDAEFPVIGKSVKSKLFSVSDCQSIVKRAVVESLKLTYKQTTWFEEKGPLYRIEVALLKDIVTLTIDTSGVGLHKRGYRADQGEAPLKETLAATLVKLTNWTADKPFIDPFCGSGTIPIEAALIGQNIAPGFNRDFASEKWHWIDQKHWDEASLGDIVTFKQMQVKDITSRDEYGVVIGNPPYGERIGEKKEVEQMYKDMGKAFEKLPTWSIYMLTSHPEFEQLYGKQATKKRKLFNGFIRTDYYQFWGPRPPRNA
jgi:putative N6-adenine-specific DNA methylase